MKRALPLLVVVAAACPATPIEPGGRCSPLDRCSGAAVCVEGSCEALPANLASGSACRVHEQCAKDARCEDGRCIDEVLRESVMREQSGLGASAPPAPIAPGGARVRVRTAKTVDGERSFAICGADERLIGGGCRDEVFDKKDTQFGNVSRWVQGYPTAYSEVDTLGGRWVCERRERFEFQVALVAYALCQETAPPRE